MTIGQLIDAIVHTGRARGLDVYRFDWVGSAFENLRIGARRQGKRGPGPVAILKNANGNWSRADVERAVARLEKMQRD